MTAELHYIYDPLCGWCYGAEPLVLAAAGVEGLSIVMHGGGLWPQPTRLPEDMRAYIRQADGRVGALSGQPYGAAYLDGLLQDPTLTLHSRPTIAAVLAAQSIDPAAGLAMLRGIQHAHYERGQHVIRPEVLLEIAAEVGLDREAFTAALERVDPDAHIRETRGLMDQVGAQGFPTMLLSLDGEWHGVPNQRFAGNPTGFAAWLRGELARHAAYRRPGRDPPDSVGAAAAPRFLGRMHASAPRFLGRSGCPAATLLPRRFSHRLR